MFWAHVSELGGVWRVRSSLELGGFWPSPSCLGVPDAGSSKYLHISPKAVPETS